MVEFSTATTYLADANLFISAGTPGNEKAEALINFFSLSEWTLLILSDINDELTDETRRYSRHRTLQRALNEGWAEIVCIQDDPVAPVQEIKNSARMCIANETNRQPDDIEDADVKLVAAAAEISERESVNVGIITNDRAAGNCFNRVLAEFGYEQAEYMNAMKLLQALCKRYNSENS